MGYPTEMFDEVAELNMERTRAYDESNDLDPENIKQELEVKLREYERLPGGTYRSVYASDSHVLKLAVNDLGVKENSAEIRNCTRISRAKVRDVVGDSSTCDGDKYIADVKEYETGNHRWLVMQKAEVTPDNVSPETADEIKDAFAEAGIHIDEIEPYNMGRIGDVPVVFDYAGTS